MDDENEYYKIITVDANALDYEALGSKEKFWFYGDDRKVKWLFKYSRENTGEHWSEKASEQLCELLGIPHVTYELASYQDRLGVISKNIVSNMSRMVMGNEVLHNHSPKQYPRPERENEKYVRVKEHTIHRILGCLDRTDINPPGDHPHLKNLNAGDVFCGYLMLDALVSNQDRHHENWAIIVDSKTGKRELCPSYDHAASLGRELTDEEREERLLTKDHNRTINMFVQKSRSLIFRSKMENKPLFTLDAFFEATKKRPVAKNFWLDQLNQLENKIIEDVFRRIPKTLATDLTKEFSTKMVLANKQRLLSHE